MIRWRGPLSAQVIVYAGRDGATGLERYVRRTVRGDTPTKTRKAAEAAERRLTLELADGQRQVTTATLGDTLDAWLELVASELSPTTLAGYRMNIRVHIKPALGNVTLARLTTARLDRFYAQLRTQGLAPATVRRIHAIIRRALTNAQRWGWITANPAAVPGTAPKVPKHQIRPPELDVARRLIAEADKGRDRDFGIVILLAATIGARRGELCGLRWSRVDLVDGVIEIVDTIIQTEDREILVKATKTDEPRRVSLDPETLARLRGHRQHALERALAAGVKLVPDAYVASHVLDGSEPIRPEAITRRFIRLRDRIGATGVRLHDLRHFHATLLLDAGIPLATVSERLGHRDQSTTANIYSHPVSATDRVAAATIGRLLAAPGDEPREAHGR